MRIVTISLAQLLQLKSARKSFIVLLCGSWQTKHQNQWVRSLQQKVGSDPYVLFRLVINVNSDSEEYCIDTLNVLSLPSLALFSEGHLHNVIDISVGAANVDLTECRNADYLFEELIKFHPLNRTVINFISESSSFDSAVRTSIGHLFLSGDRSSVGKSSMCLAILVSLLKKGVPPSALAYIKPVTQCEAEQPVTVFCDRVGIANRGIGPVVFYKGFTRAYLAGETGPAEALLEEAKTAVEDISRGKVFTLVDGVGYPSVGSICNLSNADVARKLNSPVLLVGKSGVGDAVDSYNLNSAFFDLKGVRVLGGVFNKLPLDGYYSLENCKEAVTSYFEQYKPHEMPYGFVPVVDAKPTEKKCSSTNNHDTTMDVSTTAAVCVESNASVATPHDIEYTEFENALSEALMAHVDLDRLMHDIWMVEVSPLHLFLPSLHFSLISPPYADLQGSGGLSLGPVPHFSGAQHRPTRASARLCRLCREWQWWIGRQGKH